MREAHLVGRKAVVEFDDCDLVSPFAFGESCLREDFVGTSSCHGETNKLYRAPSFEGFDTIGHQCIPRDLYRLILQPALVDKILRRNNATCCAVLENLKFRNGERTMINAY